MFDRFVKSFDLVVLKRSCRLTQAENCKKCCPGREIITPAITIIATITAMGIPMAGVVGILGLIEGIIYRTKNDKESVKTHIQSKKGWLAIQLSPSPEPPPIRALGQAKR